MNKTTKHYHYVDSPTMPHRLVIELDPVKMPGMPYGAIDWIYNPTSTETDFVSNRLAEIRPIVRNEILVIQDVFEAGTVITIALRAGQVLEEIVLDDPRSMVELVNDAGMLYWILVGRTGVFNLRAKVVQDRKGPASKIGKIRANMKNHVYRDYLAKQVLIGNDVTQREWPQLMTFAEASEYTGLSVHTLRHQSPKELPRFKRKLRKQDLNKFLEKKRR